MAARLTALLIAALAVVLLPTAMATGAGNSTTIVLSLKNPAFHGTLKSSKSACATGRTPRGRNQNPCSRGRASWGESCGDGGRRRADGRAPL